MGMKLTDSDPFNGYTRREILRLALLFGGGAALTPVLIACGSTTTPTASDTTPTAQSGQSTAVSTARTGASSVASSAQASGSPVASTIEAGQSSAPTTNITIAASTYHGTLDYRKLTDFNDWRVAELTYSALVRNDDQFQPLPDLAARWEIPDPQTIVFHLRNAKFHDGTDVTSIDVKSTFDTVLDKNFGATNRSLFAAIATIDAPDPHTIIMHLSAPNPALMAFLPWVGIVPKHYADASPDKIATNPIGCGPYKFVSTIQQSETVLEAFDGYWGGQPAFRQIKYRIIPEDTTRTVEIQSGNVDIATQVAFADVASIKKDNNLQVVNVPPNGFNYIGLNLKNPALSDLNVRQAIAYAIDRDAINAAVYEHLAANATGPVIPTSWGYEPNVPVYNYDPAKAKQLLASAGQTQGIQLKLTTLNSPEFTQMATILKQQLDAVGIKIDITPLENTVLTSQVVKGLYGDMLLGFGWGQQMDPLQHMYRQLLTDNEPPNGYDFVYYSNPKLDTILKAANVESDHDKRKSLISDAQKIVAADVPYVFLFTVPEFWAVSKKVANVKAPSPMDRRFFQLAMNAKKA